jgi:hypothetical protein
MREILGTARVWCAAIAAAVALLGGLPRAQAPPQLTGLDYILDTYVRDGYVYYRALQIERGRLDAYVGQLAGATLDGRSREAQIAFWLNAYNALVLRTVVDNYPPRRRSEDYPERSIRQIPGAFERLTHRVAGRTLTLDQIEKEVFPTFSDPRLYFAVGRGAVGGGRLRSESFTPEDLAAQLSEVADECVTRAECMQLDRSGNRLMASAIFSWHEQQFVDAYAAKADARYSARSPIERAVLGFVQPRLLQSERDFLEPNTFQFAYRPFDWSLNDLTGR